MSFSERFQAGFALAAAAHSDRRAERARAGLAPELAAEVTAIAEHVAALEPRARRAFVRGLLRPARVTGAVNAHPRALALIAQHAERAQGARWLALAPHARAGYAPDPRLVALLVKLAAGGPR